MAWRVDTSACACKRAQADCHGPPAAAGPHSSPTEGQDALVGMDKVVFCHRMCSFLLLLLPATQQPARLAVKPLTGISTPPQPCLWLSSCSPG